MHPNCSFLFLFSPNPIEDQRPRSGICEGNKLDLFRTLDFNNVVDAHVQGNSSAGFMINDLLFDKHMSEAMSSFNVMLGAWWQLVVIIEVS